MAELGTRLPSGLNTDAQWAQLIAWLQARGLVLHVPHKEAPWFSRKSVGTGDGMRSQGAFNAKLDAQV